MNRTQTDVQSIWRQYKRNGNGELRNQLVEHYLHLVKYNAERIHAKLPDEVELDDLISAGIFGLIGAIDAFDLARGVKFETYCVRWQDHVGFGRITTLGAGLIRTLSVTFVTTPQAYLRVVGWNWGAELGGFVSVGRWYFGKGASGD